MSVVSEPDSKFSGQILASDDEKCQKIKFIAAAFDVAAVGCDAKSNEILASLALIMAEWMIPEITETRLTEILRMFDYSVRVNMASKQRMKAPAN